MAGWYDSPGPVSSANLLLRPRDHVPCTREKTWSGTIPPLSRALGFTCVTRSPRMNIGAQYVARRIVTSYLGYFLLVKKDVTGSGVITYDKLASSRGQYRLVKRKKWHENRYTWLGTIFRCFCIISGHASLQRFLRSYLFARFSRPLLIAFMQIYFKNGRGRSGTTSVLTTNIFPRNSRAMFRSSYSVENFWGTCRRICGRKIFFDYFERFDRFNRLAVVGSGIHLILFGFNIFFKKIY